VCGRERERGKGTHKEKLNNGKYERRGERENEEVQMYFHKIAACPLQNGTQRSSSEKTTNKQ